MACILLWLLGITFWIVAQFLLRRTSILTYLFVLQVCKLNTYVFGDSAWMGILHLLLHLGRGVTLTWHVALHVAEAALIKRLGSILSIIVFAWHSQILLGELAGGRNRILLLQLLNHHVRNLFLRTLQEPVDLTLPLVLDWIVAALNTGWIHRQLASRTLALFFVWPGYHNSWLRARWAWARSPHLSVMAFSGLFEIRTFDLLILILIWVVLRFLVL